MRPLSACAPALPAMKSRCVGRRRLAGNSPNIRPCRSATALSRIMSGETYEALVLGGGPAGATAALLLARAGWHVAIVEKSTFPRRKVCGEFISATTLPLLRALGIADSYLALAGPEVR